MLRQYVLSTGQKRPVGLRSKDRAIECWHFLLRSRRYDLARVALMFALQPEGRYQRTSLLAPLAVQLTG
jgi:hypothetical protein